NNTIINKGENMSQDKNIDPQVLEYSEKLTRLGIKHEIITHPELKNARQTLGYFNLTMSDGVATLLMKGNDKFIAIVRRDDCQLNLDKIKEIFGFNSLRMATPEEFVEITKLPVGTARPYLPGVSTLLDQRLFEKESLIGGSGSFNCSIKYQTSDLKKIPGSKAAEVSFIDKEKTILEKGTKHRVFSGCRPTARLHIGNYLGAVKGMIDLQNRGDLDCLYSVVDLHGITTPYNSKTFQSQIRAIALDYLGAGLDPEKCHFMIQSQVPQHVELAYFLGTIYPVSRVEQLPTYKDKKKENPDYINVGLFYYPILMAADILVYKAELVPVGLDQEPHLEVTREIARKFNSMFGRTFPEPQRFATTGEYIPSLKGEGKMSKSVEGSYILLTDDLETIKKRLAGAPTDSGRGSVVPKEGGVANLLELVRLFEGDKGYEGYVKDYLGVGIRYSELKNELSEAIYKELKPIQERRAFYEQNPKLVTEILEQGRQYASQIAKATLTEVKEKMGFI
ncbi:MAG: tryptophan--tRNA ligase, partial [Patescibacteria group bacterium]|nr:tryptophan--tRNA ligase [Patescibacteria group bacterium]